MSSEDHGIERLWERIAAWLRSHGSRSAARLPGVDAVRIRQIERELGTALPSALVALWRLEGVERGYWLPPASGNALEEPGEALGTRAILLEVADQEDPADPMWAERFVPELMPIAMDGGGNNLVVDLRSGEHHGAVFFWDHEVWGLKVPLWPSVTAMLADTAHALETGTPALLWHVTQGGAESPCVPVVNAQGRFEGWEAA
jgi:cell wall assembly regulator SMI1